jgi:hypothetical protein
LGKLTCHGDKVRDCLHISQLDAHFEDVDADFVAETQG